MKKIFEVLKKIYYEDRKLIFVYMAFMFLCFIGFLMPFFGSDGNVVRTEYSDVYGYVDGQKIDNILFFSGFVAMVFVLHTMIVVKVYMQRKSGLSYAFLFFSIGIVVAEILYSSKILWL